MHSRKPRSAGRLGSSTLSWTNVGSDASTKAGASATRAITRRCLKIAGLDFIGLWHPRNAQVQLQCSLDGRCETRIAGANPRRESQIDSNPLHPTVLRPEARNHRARLGRHNNGARLARGIERIEQL